VPHLRLAALLAAATLLAAGCSDDDPQPRLEPTPSASLTESPSPTEPSPTTAPLEPVQVVKAWVDGRNTAMSQGDFRVVRSLSSASCESCSDLIDPIEQTHANGGRYETVGWQVERARVTNTKSRAVEVTAGLKLAGGTTYASATAEPVVYQAEKRIAIFELTQTDGNWQVSLIGFVQ
jgi:hypothetical protein